MGNDLQATKQQTMLQTSQTWVQRFIHFSNDSKINFDEQQKEIIVSGVRKLYEGGFDLTTYDTNNVADVLYTLAFFRWQPSAMPRHCYFQETKIYEDGKLKGKKLEVRVEGEGNDQVLRNYGVGIKRDQNGEAVGIHKVWIVREGDEYQEGYYEGIEYKPPRWKPSVPKVGQKKGKVIKVVYPIERTNNRVEYWSADREDLQPIIIKHIENNLMGYRRAKPKEFRELIKGLMNMTFDEILEKYDGTEIQYTAYGKTNTVTMIQDSYTGATGEAMIIRKLRNIATRTFPKQFGHIELERLYEGTFEEKYEPKQIVEELEDKLENEITENAGAIDVELEKKKQVVVEPIQQVYEEPKIVEPINKEEAIEMEIDNEIGDDFFNE